MSEISEQDARKAAIDIVDGHYGESNEDLDQWHDDIRTCSRWIVQELSRRDAELAEREKPITAEWCLANGATLDGTAGACQFIAHGIEVEWDARNGVTVRDGERMGDWTFLSSITTRGQLLDLLRALKGGCVNP